MAFKKQIISTAKNMMDEVHANAVANFKRGKEAKLTMPSMLTRARAIVNEDKVYNSVKKRIVNGNEFEN